MAIQEHVALVFRGPDAVNQARAGDNNLILDLSDANFSGLVFRSGNLSNANLRGANLSRADFAQTNFVGADLTNADLQSASCVHANFSRANFTNATLTSIRLDETDLSGANLSNADCTNAILASANLLGAITDQTNFTGASFDRAKVTTESIRQAQIGRANFSSVDLTEIDFSGYDLRRTTFIGAILKRANLSGANLEEANLQNAKFEGANFRKANLTQAILVQANLVNADLTEVNAARANLSNANMTRANIDSADFYEAILDIASMERIVGASVAKHLLTTKVRQNVLYFDTADRSWPERWFDWEWIRTFGRLPLFGASYTGLILIPTYVYFLGIYNEKLDAVRAWVTHLSTTQNGLSANAASAILNHLHFEPIPSSFFLLFISTMFLAIASTLYVIFCPSRVKEFSRAKWCDEMERPLIHYWPEAWKYRLIRVVCALFYILGGLGTLYVLLSKFWRVTMILYHSPFPF